MPRYIHRDPPCGDCGNTGFTTLTGCRCDCPAGQWYLVEYLDTRGEWIRSHTTTLADFIKSNRNTTDAIEFAEDLLAPMTVGDSVVYRDLSEVTGLKSTHRFTRLE